ncbi:LacI family DNA-binding transcriptional regulator [uncultured Cellulomonas sp.]|uniref:LacI family DNA-binding transcriptional regulator n=1 Tax=uncultured Cellulomonas sp. TaxID=189682 RepID=UPI00262F30FC|nr:LacI family DNA-binding transcriptional regulator [uncultured Cellulomonas sp.]
MSDPAGPPGARSVDGSHGRGRITLEQVAHHAGVSRATASRVVNGASFVDRVLVDRVNQAIRDLRYVPNLAARSLVTRRTDAVVLVAAESSTRFFSNPFFAAIVRGVSTELARSGMRLVLSMAQTPDDIGGVERSVRSGHVDGVLVISEHAGLHAVERLAGTGVPLVVGGRPMVGGLGVDIAYVDHDNRRGARLAAERLTAVGRTRVGTVTGPQDMSAGVDRLEGFRAGLGPRFDADLVQTGDFTTQGGAAAAVALMRRRPDLDGLFVASDMMALGAINGLRTEGRRVPQDVAVVGFDDAEMAAVSDPPLTTIRQRTADQGRLMAQALVHRLGRPVPQMMPELARDPDAVGIVLDVELVVRETA